MKFDKATVSSYVMLVVIPILTYAGISVATQDAIIGVITAIILLIGQVYNEAHNSDVISGSTDMCVEDVDEDIENYYSSYEDEEY